MQIIHKSDWLTITDKAEKTVEIDITGIIGGSFWEEDNANSKNTAEKMRAELKVIGALKADKIIVNIDSPGGSVYHGMSIHDLLAQHTAKKEVRIIGMAASIASVIAQAGDTRKIYDNALFMIHRAMGIGIGNANEMRNLVDQLNIIDSKMVNIYIKRGADQAKVNDLMDVNNGNGKWIDGKEAKDLGFIDEVFEPMKAAAVYDKDLFNKLKYPEIPIVMSEKSKEVRTIFDKMKDAFLSVFKVEGSEETNIPAEVTDKMTEFDNKLKELESENESLSNELKDIQDSIAEKDVKIQELTDSVTAKDTEIAGKVTELEGKESEINQLKAKSTKIPGKKGAEDTMPVPTPEEKALDATLKSMRDELSVVRPDDFSDN